MSDMDTVEDIHTPPSTNAGVKQENSTYATPFTPKDDGVAIPCAEVANNGGSEASGDIQPSDTQNIEEVTISKKSSKNAKVRTFSDSVWYVANVHTNCEQKTQQIIEHFDEKHRVNVWLPMQAEIRNINGTVKISKRLDITNYLFFHFSQTDERDEVIKTEILRDIRSITYVNDLFTDPITHKIATIPNSQIAAFQKMLSDDRYPVRFIPDMIAVGMKMRVKSGSLRGLEGMVESISDEKTNVYITLDHLGCAAVSIPSKLLEPVTTQDQIITIQDWLALHPYKQDLSVDKTYVNFANLTVGILEKCGMPVYGSKRKRLALSLAYYLEDKRSYLGIFDYFVRMQFRGVVHPLQLLLSSGSKDLDKYMTGYDARKINVIDIMYFLRANDNGKPRTLEVINQKAKVLQSAIESIGCKRLNSNLTYKQHLASMLQADDLVGIRRFVSWLDNCVKLYSYDAFSQPEARYLFSKCYNVQPLSFALKFSKKMKAKASVTELINTMLNEPEQLYEVIGCFRKAIHLKSSDGINHIVYLDIVSAGNYAIGERYYCRLVEIDTNKWFMIEPPVKANHKVVEYDAQDSNKQNIEYLTDEQWHEKYKDLTADKRSEVYEQRKAAEDYVDFPNPYRKEMEEAWRLPDGYDDDQVHDALSPLTAYLPKAMQLYENGEATKALGVCFDLFDMLVVLKSRELKFFIDDEGTTMYSWALADVTLYPICKIYNDKNTTQEVKSEIYSRIEAYGKIYTFPEKLCCGRAYEPNEVFSEFGSSVRELDYYGFFGLNPKQLKDENKQ